MMERALRRFLTIAQRMPGPAGLNLLRLLRLLERRLDNVVYRRGFARTRPMARQIVARGHMLVNGRRVNQGGARSESFSALTHNGIEAIDIEAGSPVCWKRNYSHS